VVSSLQGLVLIALSSSQPKTGDAVIDMIVGIGWVGLSISMIVDLIRRRKH